MWCSEFSDQRHCWHCVSLYLLYNIDFRCDERCTDRRCWLQQDACPGVYYYLLILFNLLCILSSHYNAVQWWLEPEVYNDQWELLHCYCLCYCKYRRLTREHFTLEHHHLHLIWHCRQLRRLVLHLVVGMEHRTCQWFHISHTPLRFCIILCHRSDICDCMHYHWQLCIPVYGDESLCLASYTFAAC